MIILSLGSNLGNREQNLKDARSHFNIQNESQIYESEPWGLTDQPCFLNQCIEIETDLSPQKLLEKINKIEAEMGRERKKKYGPRLIDIDILYYNDQQIKTDSLTIPHPQICNRKFVIIPLKELMDIGKLETECYDNGIVKLYAPRT